MDTAQDPDNRPRGVAGTDATNERLFAERNTKREESCARGRTFAPMILGAFPISSGIRFFNLSQNACWPAFASLIRSGGTEATLLRESKRLKIWNFCGHAIATKPRGTSSASLFRRISWPS
jgi:hypothetical protein